MVPINGIIIWSGAVGDIPSNFQLCDGTNGTKDLRDKFLVGAGSTYAVDDSGGSVSHDHAYGASVECVSGSGTGIWEDSNSAESEGLPPYVALAFIQRMS